MVSLAVELALGTGGLVHITPLGLCLLWVLQVFSFDF